jgi:hypothetical protein
MEATENPGFYLGDSLAWTEGTDTASSTLAVTSSELLAKVDRPYLSASTAKAMHSCPARMVSDRAMPSGFDLFSATEKGSAAHTVLERLYQLPPARRDKQHAMAILTEMSREDPMGDGDVDYAKAIGADPVRYNQWIAEIDASMRGIWDIENPCEIEVHATELRLDGVEVGGVPFKGFIDRIDVLKDGGLAVRDYKGLARDTPIPTPTGWTTMGDLQVGDRVLGTAGTPVTVTGKSRVHYRPCYAVSFDDGATVVCDNVHLWAITRDGTTTVVGADDLFAQFTAAPAGSMTITNPAPLDLPTADLPVDPFELGAAMTGCDAIPPVYLRASWTQRTDLMAGLLSRTSAQASSPAAAASFAELVASLGFTPTLAALDQIACEDGSARPERGTGARTILDVRQVPSVPTQCIEVDAADALYLCGRLMVPTHNSGKDRSKVNRLYDDDHGDQVRLYVEALRVSTGAKPRAGSLLYITHGKKRRVAISDTEIKKTLRGFAKSWTDLRTAVDAQRFAAVTSPLCGWCALVNSCPAGIAAGKVDRKGGAPSAIDLGIPSLRADGTKIPIVAHTPQWATARELPGAAHLSVEGEPAEDFNEGAHTMSTTDRPWKEAKPYDGSAIDGHLSLNSYAATAVFGLSSLAAEELAKGGQKVGPAPVKVLAGLLASVVLEAQATVTNGSRDWQEGANTRIRGVLRTSLGIIPLPFGQDEAAWTKWAGRTRNFIIAVAATAIDLYDNGPTVDLGVLVQVIVPAAPTIAAVADAA